MGRTKQLDFEQGESNRRFVTALARGLDVLTCFRIDEKWLTNTEIARRTGLPKATIARLAYTLCVLGYLRYSTTSGKYALGDSMAALGITMATNIKLRRIARPYMQELAEECNASVSLGVRHGLSVVYVENYRSSAPLSLGLDIGAQIPIASTAMGRALLCVLDTRERERLLHQLRVNEPEEWAAQQGALDAAGTHWRQRGFTMSVREWESDISAVGAAIRLSDGNVVAFNVGGPAAKLRRNVLEQDIGPRLARMVRGLEVMLHNDE